MVTITKESKAQRALQGRARADKPAPRPLTLAYSEVKPFTRAVFNPARLLGINKNGARISVTTPMDNGNWIRVAATDGQPDHPRMPSFLKSGSIKPAQVIRDRSNEKNGTPEDPKKPFTYDLAFANSFTSKLRYLSSRMVPTVAVLFLLVGIANVLYLKSLNVYYYWYQPVLNTYSILMAIYILSRFVFAAFYKAPKDTGHRPSVTVIIVCKNEEDSIRETIDCVYRADYPRDLLDVITVNDGSTDNTLREMKFAAKEHPGLTVMNFEKNRGKRHGMAAGAKRAKGDVLVYIDSDSFIRRDGLIQVVQGFSDPTIGAVCGHADVTNAKTNMLTKMQEVRYFVAFRVIKAAESLFSAVSCCSGCFAAYRKSYVMPVIDTWLNQKFLGVPATFGDDRSLTNFILRKYRVIYQPDAICTTLVPETYGTFFRQQLRWKKSWIRESLIACKFMWKRHPVAAFFFYCGVLFPLIAPVIVLKAVILPAFGLGPMSYLYIYGAILMAILFSLVYLLYHRNILWIYGVTFSFFYLLVLTWQTYYAFFTVRRNHWGTR